MTPSLTLVRVIVFISFLVVFSIVYLTTSKDIQNRTQNILTQQINYLENNYKVSMNRFEIISDSLYNTVINESKILKLLYKAKHFKDESKRAVVRETLYKKMKPHFERLKKLGVIITLFSFEENKTFLRVHKLGKFNDDLSKARYSFTYVNSNKKSIRGFEQGKISHAFRNIYPLFYNGEFLGSVDIAFSSEVVQDNMIMLHDTHTHFVLNKNIFKTNIWERQKKVKYIQSIENENFLFSLTPSLSDNAFAPYKLELNGALKYEIAKNIQHNGSFAIHNYNGSVQIIAF